VNARAETRINSRTYFTFSDWFRYSTDVTNLVALDSPEASPSVGTFRQPVMRNDAELGLEYRFTPRLAGNLGFNSRIFVSDIPNRADNQVWAGSGSLVYTLSPRHQLGGGLAATFQNFDASNGGLRPPSTTLFFNPFLTWTWFVDETTSVTITGGPTFVDVDQEAPPPAIQNADAIPFADLGAEGVVVFDINDCGQVNGQRVLNLCSSALQIPSSDPDAAVIRSPANSTTLSFPAGTAPAGLSGSDWTYFAEAALSKRWTPQVASTLSYRRSDSTASGLRGSATLDIVTFLTSWRITELWRVGFRADFTRRESTSPTQTTLVVVEPSALNPQYAESVELSSAIINNALDTNRWGVMARLTRRITRNLDASLRYAFNQQASKQGTAGRRSDFDDHLVTLGVVYTFDRWRLW
jgi:opacity protein-like surface antigen